MTALKKYQRLEASGLWRAGPRAEPREVVVSLGKATLTISDLDDLALAHWSLAALARANPGQEPAIYHPDGDPGETLELAEGESTMTDAIERLRRAVERVRPRRRRGLRRLVLLIVLAFALWGSVFWLPGAMRDYAVMVVPPIKRQEIGRALTARIETLAGPACQDVEANIPLAALARRSGIRRLVVLRDLPRPALYLPGDIVLVDRSLIEDHEDPAVVAGHVVAEHARAGGNDPLAHLLRDAGPIATLRLVTTGEMSRRALARHARRLLDETPAPLPPAVLLAGFAAAEIPATPFARAGTIEGAEMAEIEAQDPMRGRNGTPVLADRDWVLLQTICGR